MKSLLSSLGLRKLLIGSGVLVLTAGVVAVSTIGAGQPDQVGSARAPQSSASSSPSAPSSSPSPSSSASADDTTAEEAPDTGDGGGRSEGGAGASAPAPTAPLPPAGPTPTPPPPVPVIKWVGITANTAACPERPDLGFSSFQIYVTSSTGAVKADGILSNLHTGNATFYENGFGQGDVWLSDYTVGPGESGQQAVFVRVFNSAGEAAQTTGYFNIVC